MNDKRKTLVGVLVVVLLVAGIVWFVGTDTLFCLTVTYEGDGTAANPYEVSNVEQLQCIEEQDLHASYELVSDIDASETAGWNDGKGFDPIGTFTGRFDGRRHNITDLTIDRDSESNMGLFGTVGSSGVVTNVSVLDADIKSSDNLGGLVGKNRGTVRNSYVTGLVDGFNKVGGLVGHNEGDIENSYATAEVEGRSRVGGLVGWNEVGVITGSHATGSVGGLDTSGGLVGLNINEGTVESSYATGDVGGSRFVGGLVGWNLGGTIKESYATGKIEGDELVGGFVGSNVDGIKKSYATGSVSGDEGVGGLVGGNFVGNEEGTISESYATGSVDGNEDVGGLVGLKGESAKVNEAYWDVEATGQSTSAGNATGLNTSQMTGSGARDNMRGFDFTDTWRTVQDDYPVLAWQAERDTRD